MNAIKKLSLVAALIASVLAGCGGGTTTSSSSLSGTAAVGAPIESGTITISCAGGNPTTPATTTTDTAGAWSLTLTGQTLPCAVQVSGGTINGVANTTPYHSIASTTGTVNVTPMTDLIVANATGSTSPSTWFASVSPTALAAITPATMTASLTQIRTALNLPALNNVNPLTTSFTPAAGNPVDDILTALQLAITNTGSSLTALRTAAANPTFTPPVGFSTAMNTQHGNTASGGASAPAAPSGLVATAISSSQINLTWSAVTGATSYNVYAATATGVALTAANKKNTTAITSTSYSGTGLAAGTTFYIKVTALNPAGESVGSSEATAATQAAATTGGSTSGTASVPTGFVARNNPSGALTLAPAAIVWTGSRFIALELNQNFHSSTATLFSWTSTDGITWTRNTTNLPNGLGALTAANGKAFMMGGGGATTSSTVNIYSTTDGINWTSSMANTSFSTGANGVSLGVKYLNNKYIATFDTNACNALTSTDGTTWTTTNLSNLALPTGYTQAINNNYCGEAFYVGGNYVISGGIISLQARVNGVTTFTYQGLTYTSTDGTTWVVNAITLPSTINSILQGGRVNTALQIGSNFVLPAVRTEAQVRLQPTDPFPTQVLSNYQAGVSSNGVTFTFTAHSGTPDLSMISLMAGVPSLDLPSGKVGYKSVSAVVGGVVTTTRTYGYTTDGYTFTTAPDLMFKSLLQAAYSPTLGRLVVIRQESNATTFANSGVTIGTMDFPVSGGSNSGGGSSSGVTFSSVFGGVSSITNTTPTTSVSSGMTTQTYTGGLGFSYRLNSGIEEFNLTFIGSALSALNNSGFSAAPGSCAVSANSAGAPLCSSFGIIFNKSSGTVAFSNTPMGTGLFGNAPTIFTLTGTLTFTPF